MQFVNNVLKTEAVFSRFYVNECSMKVTRERNYIQECFLLVQSFKYELFVASLHWSTKDFSF